jgi:hypothetical protein
VCLLCYLAEPQDKNCVSILVDLECMLFPSGVVKKCVGGDLGPNTSMNLEAVLFAGASANSI